MTVKLEDFQDLGAKSRRKRLNALTEREKLELVDAIIDRDVEIWKGKNREYCDFGYYFRFIDGGVALSERQR